MTSGREVRRRQRRWAKSAGLTVDPAGYLASVELNLRRPLSAPARDAFERGHGAELRAHGARPAKMRALHSSAALAVNVFDHWTERDAAPLQRALDLEAEIRALSFEARFATGLPGNPPNLDVALELASGDVVGIESKFTEWLTPKRASRPPFKDKYFDGDAALWAARGLPDCQALARDMMQGTERFRHLDAAQLLKHALGLATQRPGACALRYVYLDIAGAPSGRHRRELERFAARVDAGLRFSGASYQTLVERLSSEPSVDADYLRYLRSRYVDRAAP